MRRQLASLRSLRLTAIIVVIMLLATLVVFGQGAGEKTLDDAMQFYEQAITATGQARFQNAIELLEEALVIVQQLQAQTAEGLILSCLGICYESPSDYQRAIGYHERALAIFREVGVAPAKRKSLASHAPEPDVPERTEVGDA